jgi:antitoxin component YwqK of YwqJK toxin-antitoxin module
MLVSKSTAAEFLRHGFEPTLQRMLMVMKIGILAMAQLAAADTVSVVYNFPDGSISSEGQLINNLPDGYWRNFHPGGILASEGNRVDGLLAGTWTFFDGQGRLTESVRYQRDAKWGEAQTFDSLGIVILTTTWERDTMQGPMRRFDADARKLEEWTYVDGQRSGSAWQWDPSDGRVITRSTWREGLLRQVEKVNRYDRKGLKLGRWLVFWRHAAVREDGPFEAGLREGVFKFFSRAGDLERIETYHLGNLIPSEEGAVILDVRKTYGEGGIVERMGPYQGETAVGLHQFYDGQGEATRGEIYDDGVVTASGPLEGKGAKTGLWQEFWPDGSVRAEGDWDTGKKNGVWSYFDPDGQLIQRGRFRAGAWEDTWRWYYDNGVLHRQEEYRRGLEEGLFVELSQGGDTLARGVYEAGLKSGEWIEHVNDHRRSGAYLDGEFHGEWRWFYADDRLVFKGEFSAGLPIGSHVRYFPTGRKSSEGKYEGGLKSGNWRYFDALGQLKLVRQYQAGRVVRLNGARIQSRRDE